MIDELHVRDLALIHEAELYPSPGLTVITGETGAGKTALLGALKLLTGERGDSSLVRQDTQSLQVQARLFLHGAHEAEEDESPDGVVVSRSVNTQGRSRVHIDGAIASVSDLAEIVGAHIDICGQHENQRLLKSANHRVMLDAWMGESAQEYLGQYQDAFAKVQQALAVIEDIERTQNLSSEQVEQARYTLRRIDEVKPQEGEYEQLCATLPKIENAEILMRNVEGARSALCDDGGTLESLGTAIQLIDQLASIDEHLAAHASSLRDASYIIEDIAMEVRRYQDDIDFDASSLEEMQNRMGELQGLMRTWGPSLDEVLKARAEAERIVDAKDGFARQMAEARKRLDAAEAELDKAACALHACREKAAPVFSQAVSKQMARLELGDAALECCVELMKRESWTKDGPDKVEFLFRPGKKLSARPLVKIASGGEISRVMLAVKVVLGEKDQAQTLIFDEVDAGVGGNAARALADVLADLAKSQQLIVVTHLAQVAVLGQVHYIAHKSDGEVPQTTFTQVEGQDRIAEIARMLSGDTSLASLEHARQMLESAGQE